MRFRSEDTILKDELVRLVNSKLDMAEERISELKIIWIILKSSLKDVEITNMKYKIKEMKKTKYISSKPVVKME